MNTNIKKRFARRLSHNKIFSPSLNLEGEVRILLDEYEAMRLCDYEQLSQIEASEQMKISRGTIQRLLNSSRFRFVDATLNNKKIIIDNSLNNINIKGENNMDKHLEKNILLAIPTNDKQQVSNNFGGADYLAIYKLINKEINFIKIINLPEHVVGEHPKFLKENKIDLVLTKAIGRKAIDLLKEYNIDVALGFNGNFKEVINEYLEGALDFKEEAKKYTRNREDCFGQGRRKGNGHGLGRGCTQGLGLGKNNNG